MSTFLNRLFIFIFIISTALILCACHNKKEEKKDDIVTISTLLEKDSSRLNLEFEKGKIIGMWDKLADTSMYGYYTFYPSGELKSYKFFSSSIIYGYNEEYDSLGKTSLVEGNPLVLHGYKKIDSISVGFNLLFYSLKKDYQSIVVSTNTGIILQPQLYKHQIFTNIKTASFTLPVVKSFHQLKIFTKFSFIDSSSLKRQIVMDTIRFDDESL
jgi:hypothetical protein